MPGYCPKVDGPCIKADCHAFDVGGNSFENSITGDITTVTWERCDFYDKNLALREEKIKKQHQKQHQKNKEG